MTLPANLAALTAADLNRLVDVVESRTIEYKRDLPGASSEEKVKFLAAVTAFANALGGHLLYGIEAVDGVPNSFPGVPGASEDDLEAADREPLPRRG